MKPLGLAAARDDPSTLEIAPSTWLRLMWPRSTWLAKAPTRLDATLRGVIDPSSLDAHLDPLPADQDERFRQMSPSRSSRWSCSSSRRPREGQRDLRLRRRRILLASVRCFDIGHYHGSDDGMGSERCDTEVDKNDLGVVYRGISNNLLHGDLQKVSKQQIEFPAGDPFATYIFELIIFCLLI